MTIDEAIIPLSPDEWVYDRLEDDVINSTRSINGNHEELLDTTFRATVVPRITFDSNRIGYFHDYDEEHGSDIAAESSAVLFDVSTSPMLSVLQLRHANLSDYSHGSSYILGNSYASSQVARYKTWGRVKSIAWIPDSVRMNISMNEASSKRWAEIFLFANFTLGKVYREK